MSKEQASNYAKSGVDRTAATAAKELIAKHARSTFTPDVMGDIGFFGSLFKVSGFKDPVLVSHTDGVGTKLKIASSGNRYDTVGIDLVNHCINDILTCGAKPLFFLDYIGSGKVRPENIEKIAKGLAEACKEAECALIGGETAELPGLYSEKDFDLVGFVVGAAEKKDLIDGSSITDGDLILGLPSSGLHTNGFSLVRKVFNTDSNPEILDHHYPELGKALIDELLVPHRSYYPPLSPFLQSIKGMIHITGGGFIENIPRTIPNNLSAHLKLSAWTIPPIYKLIQKEGKISDREMFSVFNMGIGMMIVVDPADSDNLLQNIPDSIKLGYVSKNSSNDAVIIDA